MGIPSFVCVSMVPLAGPRRRVIASRPRGAHRRAVPAIAGQANPGRLPGLHSRPPDLPAHARASSPPLTRSRDSAGSSDAARFLVSLDRGRRRCPVGVRGSFEVGSRHGVSKAGGRMGRNPPQAAAGCRTTDGGELRSWVQVVLIGPAGSAMLHSTRCGPLQRQPGRLRLAKRNGVFRLGSAETLTLRQPDASAATDPERTYITVCRSVRDASWLVKNGGWYTTRKRQRTSLQSQFCFAGNSTG